MNCKNRAIHQESNRNKLLPKVLWIFKDPDKFVLKQAHTAKGANMASISTIGN